MDFFEAYEQVFAPLATASNVMQLVGRAEDAGLMAAMRTPVTTRDAVAQTGLSEETVSTLCRALVALGVVQHDVAGFSLTEPWLALTDPGAFVPLGVALSGAEIDGRLLRAKVADTFWSMPAEDRITYARSISPDPYSDQLVERFRTELENDPDRAAMTHGGRLLELGCGVAGRVLTTLRAMPQLRAVGVELSPDLAGEARRRASELGLDDRFEVVCMDAADFTTTEPFDYGFWSQFFFPSSSREGALRTLRSALRTGGVVHAPLGANFAAMDADPDGSEARDFAVWRVVLDSWGVPERRPEQLVTEFEAAGFTDVEAVARDAGAVVRARQP